MLDSRILGGCGRAARRGREASRTQELSSAVDASPGGLASLHKEFMERLAAPG